MILVLYIDSEAYNDIFGHAKKNYGYFCYPRSINDIFYLYTNSPSVVNTSE